MSENPRIPGTPSDGISSRTDEGRVQHSNPAPVNVYNNPANPPAPASGNSHLKNLIIGSIITAVASISVYYATVYMNRNKDSNNAVDEKLATKKVWQSFVAYENTYTKNLMTFEQSFVQNANFDEYLGGLRTESAKFSKDLGDVIKSKNIDIDLVKAMNRRLENERVSLGKVENFIITLQSIMKDTTLTPKLTTEKYILEQLRWNREYKGMYERAVNDIREIAKTLSDRYGEKFSMDDLLILQMMPQKMKTNDSLIAILQNVTVDENGKLIRKADPDGYDFVKSLTKKDITGSWNADGNAITIKDDGKLFWVLPNGDKASGTWTISGNLIVARVLIENNRRKAEWHFYVSRPTANTFTLTNADPPNEAYHLVRLLVN